MKKNPKNSQAAASPALLAWAGWSLSLPDEWQPLKLSGTSEKGQVVVGNSEYPIFILKWERAQNAQDSKGREWVEQRLKKMGVVSDANPPAAAAFTACGWAHGVQTEEQRETTYWFGYSAPADLLLGITVNGELPKSIRLKTVHKVLPTLQTTPVDAIQTWAMYSVSFLVPSGFELARRHLYSGDVALEFTRGRRDTLLLRQVYPAELALKRRSMEKWIAHYPFKDHRRVSARSMQVQDCRRGELAGLERRGWKRLPAPLGWCAPRRVHGLAVHDEGLKRLLIAEYLSVDEPAQAVCETAIAGMNVRREEG